MTDLGAVRLTIDSDVRAVPVDRNRFAVGLGETVTPQRIVEVKFRRHLPLIFREMVHEFALTPRAISKYRLAAAGLGLSELGLAEEHVLCRAS
jgi:hypothetical protein